MEMVALDMKRRGMYIARQLSFASAEYQTDIVDLSASQRGMYDGAALFWKEMLSCFHYARQALDFTRKGHPEAQLMTQFWGSHQRFFRALCMSLKVPELVEIAKQALAEGKCVVIGLQSTGEARLHEAMRAGESLDDFRGLKEMAKVLVSRLPDGDYLRRYHDPHDNQPRP